MQEICSKALVSLYPQLPNIIQAGFLCKFIFFFYKKPNRIERNVCSEFIKGHVSYGSRDSLVAGPRESFRHLSKYQWPRSSRLLRPSPASCPDSHPSIVSSRLRWSWGSIEESQASNSVNTRSYWNDQTKLNRGANTKQVEFRRLSLYLLHDC